MDILNHLLETRQVLTQSLEYMRQASTLIDRLKEDNERLAKLVDAYAEACNRGISTGEQAYSIIERMQAERAEIEMILDMAGVPRSENYTLAERVEILSGGLSLLAGIAIPRDPIPIIINEA